MISILDYEMLGFDEYVSETVTVLEKHRECEVIKGMKWYFIELPKFRKSHPDMNERLNQWLAFIDDYDKGVIEMVEKKNKTIERARVEMNYLTGDRELRRLAELREKWEMDYADTMVYGREKGLEEGRREGRQEGRREGKIEGARQKQLEIAKRLLKKGMKMEEIQEITELEKREIENLMDSK